MHAQCVKNMGALCDMGKHSRMILSMNDVHINRTAAANSTYAGEQDAESQSRVTARASTPLCSTPTAMSVPSSHAPTPPAEAMSDTASVSVSVTAPSGGMCACVCCVLCGCVCLRLVCVCVFGCVSVSGTA